MQDGLANAPTGGPFPKGQPFIANGILYQDDAHVATWVQAQLGEGVVYQAFVALGIVHPDYKGERIEAAPVHAATVPLAAGAIFWGEQFSHDWSDMYVTVFAADVTAAHPRIISDILAYPFGVRKARRLSAEIAASNERAIRQAEKLGFIIEGIKRKGGPEGSDIVCLGLIPQECPFWPPEKVAKA